jgi:hypothetical protein
MVKTPLLISICHHISAPLRVRLDKLSLPPQAKLNLISAPLRVRLDKLSLPPQAKLSLFLGKKGISFLIFNCSLLFPFAANALPGQTTDEVAAWIQANPTLNPQSGETLLVRKSDTAAQRFVFQASTLPPGRATPPLRTGVVRSERFEIFDLVNGVNADRLQETLRIIYGLGIYQDFQQARVVYAYPDEMLVNQARSQNAPLLEALQGELRLGKRFAYWLEVAQPREGRPIMGRMTILLPEDLDKIQTELRNR